MEYVTEKRSSDWIAYIKGHPEMWEAGETEDEAVQKLIVSRGNGNQDNDSGNSVHSA